VSTVGLFFAALGMAILLEGLVYFAFPAGLRRYMEQLQRTSDGMLRTVGFVMILLGLGVLYLALR
jgi:uncharacterized protein YjeT (DUF2065 family)